jgi:hypothetical protein
MKETTGYGKAIHSFPFMVGRMVVGLFRNDWSIQIGMSGQKSPEYALNKS